ncbi:MAG: LEPR-XLL domain-containing protein, partial [Phycisphaeraceae bacterium]
MSVEARRAKRAHRGLEVLEPRLLFSGNPLLPSEVESIRDGLAALETLGQRIDQQAVLADARGVFGAGLTPGNTQSLGDAFDASQSLRAAIVQPALDYFAQTANPSATGLRDAIDTALNGLAGVGQVTVESLSPPSAPTDSFEFDIDFSWTQGPAGALTIDLAEWVPAGLVQTNGVLEIEVSPTLEMGLTIGLDRGAASTAEGFYARFDQAPGANRLGLTFDAADGFTASGNIGALGITLGLDAASELFSFDVPFLAGAGNLSAAQLEASPLASTLVPAPLTPTPFVLTLPITVDAGIDGFDPQGAALLIRDFDLFDGLFDAQNGSDVVVINGDAFAPFRNLSIDALFNGLTGLEDTFTSLARNDAFNQAVPLLDSVGLGDLAPLGEAIAQRITAPAGNDTDAGGQAGQRGAAFTSLQALAGLVGNGLSYDPATRELVIDLSFSHLFASESVELGLSRGLGELDGFELSAGVVADVALQLDASFGLGISLETNGVASRSGIEPTPFIDASTPMSYFGLSVDTGTLNASGDDLRITLRDGTTAGFSLTDTPTLGQLLDSINAAFGPNLEASFETRTDPISGSAFNVGLRLEDKTTAGPNAALRVESVGGSLAAFALSIARSAPDGVIESGAIHGRGLIDQWFIRQHHADPFVQVTAQLTADDIDAGAMLGPVEIGIVDGTAAGQFGAALSLTQTSLTLREAMGLAPGDLAFAFTGSANLDLPFSASVAGLTLPASPRIAVSIPDLRADLSDASNLVVDLSEIGDLAALTGLDVGDFTTLLNGALDLLAGLDALEGLDFYNADLPLIDLSLSEAFDFAKAFEPVVSAFASDSGTTLNTVEQVIENLFGGQDVVDLSMDGDSAIRLDLRFDVGDLFNAFEDKLTLDAPLRLDLSTLSGDVEGMGDLIDFKAEADFGVEVGADVFISLGLDVSNPDNPRPFLYDANATNDAGTRIVATAEANATLNQFTASVGPFGVQIGNSDPLDPQAGVTIAGDFVIALADLDGSGRTYFDDLTAGTTPPGTLNLIGSVIGLGTLPTQLIDFEVSGSAQATLPISFPGLPIPEQVLTATIADLTQPSAIAFTGGDIFETARDALRGDFNLLNIVGGWDG